MAYNLLKGKRGLIFGALNDKSIAWKVAERAHEEGAQIVLTNTPVSIRMGTIDRLAEQCGAVVIPADATNVADLEHLVTKAWSSWAAASTSCCTRSACRPTYARDVPTTISTTTITRRTVDISAISFHKVIQTCRKLDAIEEWGSVVALSYIAAQRTLYGYNDMADAKAMLESIARSFGYIYGREKNIRINTVVAVADADHGRQRRDGARQPDGLCRADVAAGQCDGSRVCRLHHHALLGPHPQGDHAEPLPRRRLFEHG